MLRGAVRTDRERVTAVCDAAERAADTDPENADAAGARVLEQTAPLLGTLGFALADDDPALCGTQDQVARQVMRCAVAYGNRTRDWPTARELLQGALQIAATESTSADVARNLAVAEENVRDGMCWFCKERPSAESGALSRMMYGNVRYEGFRTTWQTRVVQVPRCRDCRSRHARQTVLWSLGWVAWPVAGFFGLGMLGAGNVLLGLPLLLVGVVVLGVQVNLGSQGVPRRQRRTIPEFAPIRELSAQGWRFGAKPPGVS